jgi:anti-anti-sigma regulatory factor
MSELVAQDIVAGVATQAEPGARKRFGQSAPKVMRMVLEGEISRDELGDIGDMLFRLTTSGSLNVVIDFTEVTHFDYRGVKPLMRKAEVFRELGGDVRLSGLSAYLMAIFRSAGANDAFDYFASVEDAVASFNRAIFVQGR